MTKHTLALLTYPPTQSSLREVVRDADIFPQSGPLTVSNDRGGASMRVRDVKFDGRVIGEVSLNWDEREGDTRLGVFFEARDFVPEAVHEGIANRLRPLAVRVNDLVIAKIGRERDARAQMDALLGTPDHPRVRAVLPVPRETLGALCFPGILAEAGGEGLFIHQVGWNASRVIAEVYFRHEDIGLPAFRVEDTHEEIAALGTGNRDKARAGLVQAILERGLVICQERGANPVLHADAEAVRVRIVDVANGHDDLDEYGVTGDLVRIMRAPEGEAEDVNPDYAQSITRAADFSGGLRYDSSVSSRVFTPQPGRGVEIGDGFVLHMEGHQRSDTHILQHDGQTIFDSRVGFLPGVPAPHRAALLLAMDEAVPAWAKRLPWAEARRPDAEARQDVAQFTKRLLDHFGGTTPGL